MYKTKPTQYFFYIIIAVILVVLLFPAEIILSTAASNISAAHPTQDTDDLIQFSSEGHVLAFGAGEVYLAGLDHALKLEFVDGTAELPHAERSGKAENGLPELDKVIFSEVWDNIDVVFSGASGGIAESTYIVHPGGDPAKIVLSYNVPVEITPSGGLSLSFPSGYMTETPPIAWQKIDGFRVPVEVYFNQQGDTRIGFILGSYDAANTLYIDPIYQWHTFYGSPDKPERVQYTDEGHSITVAEDGGVYVTGRSHATWQGPGGEAPRNAHSGGSDIVIAKLNSAGAYQWHTFYGSSDNDGGTGIALDKYGSIYVTGTSRATWQGPGGEAPRNTHSGVSDMVIVKLDSNGAYQWHTFYGPVIDIDRVGDSGPGIAVDQYGSVFITGSSIAAWVGPGGAAPINAYTGGVDIVIVKLSSAGFYQWHTYYGSRDSSEYGEGVALGSDGSVYITGESGRANWNGPAGIKPLNPFLALGFRYIVIIKLDSDGVYQWHTFYGSSDTDRGTSIAVDKYDNIYIAGTSRAAWEGPGEKAPLNAHSGGVADMVILKLDSDGGYQWHTFYGPLNVIGSRTGQGPGIVVDKYDNIYITGTSRHTWEGPGGEAPLNPHAGGFEKIVIAKLNSYGAYQWHTFYDTYGGSLPYHRSNSIAVATDGSIYVIGSSGNSWDGPGEKAPLNAHTGNWDMVIIKHGPLPDYKYEGDHPILLAPWEGRATIWQGNRGKYSHYFKSNTHDPTFAIDVGLSEGTQVLSMTDGYIYRVYNDPSHPAGRWMIVVSEGPTGINYCLKYGHLDQIFYQEDDPVSAGEVIALSGNTGESTGAHLHFSIWKYDGAINTRNELSIPMESLILKGEQDSTFRVYSAVEGRQELDNAIIELKTFESSNEAKGRFAVTLKSPASMRIYDSAGRVTGIIDGEVVAEIPGSHYHEGTKTASVSPPIDNYMLEIEGTQKGSYGLNFYYYGDSGLTYFYLKEMDTSPGEIHQYVADWGKLTSGNEGVSFVTDTSTTAVYIPIKPSNPSPSNLEKVTEQDVVLSWSGGGSGNSSDDIYYEIYFGSDELNLIDTIGPFIDHKEEISYDVGQLEFNTDYYWKVVSKNQFGLASEGLVWVFTTSDKANHELILIAGPIHGGLVSGGGKYEDGDEVVVKAVANPGYHFISWTINEIIVSHDAEFTILMDADYNIVANFTPISATVPDDVNETDPIVVHGDVNGDGSIDVNDALLVIKHVLKLSKLGEPGKAAADVNRDGVLDVKDITLIMRRALNIIDKFPIINSN